MRARDLAKLSDADLQELLLKELAWWVVDSACPDGPLEASVVLRQLAHEYIKRHEHPGRWCACERCVERYLEPF